MNASLTHEKLLQLLVDDAVSDKAVISDCEEENAKHLCCPSKVFQSQGQGQQCN